MKINIPREVGCLQKSHVPFNFLNFIVPFFHSTLSITTEQQDSYSIPPEIIREIRKKLFSFPQKKLIKPWCLTPGSFWFIRNLLNEHSTSFWAPGIIYSPLVSQKIHNPNMQLCKLKKWILSCVLRVTPPGIKLGIRT